MGGFIKKNLNWILGIFFILASLGGIKDSLIASILFFLISLLFIPKTFALIKEKIKFINLEKYRYLVIIFLFFISGIFLPKTPSVNKPNISDNKEKVKENIIKSEPITKKITPTPTLTLTPTSTPSSTPIFYSVIKVIDGDTIDINIDGKTQRIRVIGINTPEVVDPRKPVECFGKQASEKAKQLLEGKKVRLEKDETQGNTDKYGRLLRYVFLEDNTDFGLTMIKEGYAYEYTYNIPYKYQQQYKQAQIEAQKNKRGLWADNVCITPTLIPTTKIPTATPIIYYQPPPTQAPQVETNTTTNQSKSFVCDCSKTCNQISSCEEAYFQLNNCGCQARDGDKDGVPCENLCR